MLTHNATPTSDTTTMPEPDGWQDPLTELQGPDFWRKTLVSEVARSHRYHRPLTVVVLEIDGLAELRRDWGTGVALRALHDIAQVVRSSSRTSDQCTRIGPTRIGIVLTETDEVAAINFVERVRDAAPASLPRVGEHIQFRFGWASPTPGEVADAVVRRAEARLAHDQGA